MYCIAISGVYYTLFENNNIHIVKTEFLQRGTI